MSKKLIQIHLTLEATMDQTPRNETEAEFISAGDPDSTGKIRRLLVVTPLPEPPLIIGETTRVESLIFDDPRS